jgi:parallel beta-helix repeat protein
MNRSIARASVLIATAGTAAAAALIAAGGAVAAPTTVYVSSTGKAGAADTSCASAAFKSVQAGVNAVATGGTVIVCGGTYAEMVSVTRKTAIVGTGGATIDANGKAYGLGLGASYSSVSGMTVKNANGGGDQGPNDGIVSAAFTSHGPVVGDHLSITGNTLTGNLNAGIDLNSTQYSTASGNRAVQNGIGVNVSDDLGRAAMNNVIDANVTNQNFGGCGIALADHSGAGVLGNRVSNNVSNDNGLSTPTAPDASAGSGVILASPIPGGRVIYNAIIGNTFDGNGHGGVVIHAHAPGNFAGNVIQNNRIKTNNLRTDSHDLQTTGIYIGVVTPTSVAVTGNNIGPDFYGIFTAGPVTLSGANSYNSVTTQVGHVAVY